jgi:hypothetical protein
MVGVKEVDDRNFFKLLFQDWKLRFVDGSSLRLIGATNGDTEAVAMLSR